MSDVILIYPDHRKILGGRTYSPLGLPYIASVLEANGYKTRIIDLEIEGLDAEKLLGLISRESPGLIGINVLTSALPEVYNVIASIKSKFNIPIVVGGSHVTEVPSVVSLLGVEYGVRGEGDYSMLQLCEYLFKGNGEISKIDGLIYSSGDDLTISDPSYVEDLSGLPNPLRDGENIHRYMFTTIMASRGCPFNCIFCADPHCMIRFRSPESVFDEMSMLVDTYRIGRIDFSDSVFTQNRDFVYDLCDLLDTSSLKFKWSCLTRCDFVDDDLLKRMGESGCFLIYFGVESGVEEIRYKTGKKISDQKIKEVFKTCHKTGIKTGASMMFGFPWETLKDMEKTIDFALELDPTYAVFSLPELMPGTRLFKIACDEGYTSDMLWEEYMTGKKKDLYYAPKHLSFDELYRIDAEAHRRFYFRTGYIFRRMLGIRSKIEYFETNDLIGKYLMNSISKSDQEI